MQTKDAIDHWGRVNHNIFFGCSVLAVAGAVLILRLYQQTGPNALYFFRLTPDLDAGFVAALSLLKAARTTRWLSA